MPPAASPLSEKVADKDEAASIAAPVAYSTAGALIGLPFIIGS
jgi:hypothetical protein